MQRIFLFATLLIFGCSIDAQQSDSGFIYPVETPDAAAKTRALLDRSPAYMSVEFVGVDRERLHDSLLVIRFAGKHITVDRVHWTITEESTGSYYYFGARNNQTGDMINVGFYQDDITGTLTIGNEVYVIRTLEGNEYAMVRLDHSKLIDCPEEVQETSEPPAGWQSVVPYTPDANCRVRVLVLYTPAAAASVSNIKNEILTAIAETNQSFYNSVVTYRVELAYIGPTSYTEVDIDTDLDRFRINGDGYMDEVHTLRQTYGGDVCVLVNNDAEFCGVAATIGYASLSNTFCVVRAANCMTGYYSFGHEIGHLLGCRHDTSVDPNTTPYAFGHGYYYATAWRTIMAYANGCSGCPRLQYWANPSMTYNGTPMGTTATNHTSRVWNEQAPAVMAITQPAETFNITAANLPANALYADYSAKDAIDVAGSVQLSGNFTLSLRATNGITFQPGFTVNVGAGLIAVAENIVNCSN